MTGGAGFIGSHVCDTLVAGGESVRVIDDFSTGRRENLSHLAGKVELVEGSITDPLALREAVDGVHFVIHLAALPSVARSVADPITTDRVNIFGTLSVLLAARDARVGRVVFASSSSVYGETEVLPKTEGMTPAPTSPYALSKLAGEHYCRIFSKLYGLPTVALRFFNIFGPRQDPSSPYSGVVAIFLRKMLDASDPTILGDGEQSRDFTYVQNAVGAIRAACECRQADGVVINVGCGERHTVNHLCSVLARLTGFTGRALYASPRKGDVRDSQADISRAREILGYAPTVGFEDGLALLVAHETGRS